MRIACLLAVVLLGGCTGRTTMERHHEEGEDALGDHPMASGTSVHLHGSEAEAQLVRAQELIRKSEGRPQRKALKI